MYDICVYEIFTPRLHRAHTTRMTTRPVGRCEITLTDVWLGRP